MGKITGKVVVEETGGGVADLLVAAFAVGAVGAVGTVASGEAGSGGSAAEELWRGAGGERLGSVATDAGGRFELDWEPPQRAKSEGLALVVLVILITGPERPHEEHDAGKGDDDPAPGCPPILHVSCPRPRPGPHESFVVRLPAARLREAGLAPETRRPQEPAPQAALEALRQAARAAVERAEAGPIAERERQRRLAVERAEAAPERVAARPEALPFARPPVRGLPAGATLEVEPEGGGLQLRRPGRRPVQLAYRGVVWTQDLPPERAPADDVCLLVEPEARELRLALPRSRPVLTEPERPSPLLLWRRQRETEAARKEEERHG